MLQEPCGLTFSQLQMLSDEELMMHLNGRHDDALAILVDRYQRLVWSVAQRIVHDEGEAEDLVQAIFLELFQKVELFDPVRGTLKVWLLQLAYNRSINRLYHLQRRQFYNQVEVEDGDVLQAGPRTSTLRLTTGETARLVREVLDTLSDKQRTAVELIGFEGLTFDEVALRMGETLANAKHHYYRGMKKLRECLIEPPAGVAKKRINDEWEAGSAGAR